MDAEVIGSRAGLAFVSAVAVAADPFFAAESGILVAAPPVPFEVVSVGEAFRVTASGHVATERFRVAIAVFAEDGGGGGGGKEAGEVLEPMALTSLPFPLSKGGGTR